jgi:hypothetical protein
MADQKNLKDRKLEEKQKPQEAHVDEPKIEVRSGPKEEKIDPQKMIRENENASVPDNAYSFDEDNTENEEYHDATDVDVPNESSGEERYY